jgi:hypothetical protein
VHYVEAGPPPGGTWPSSGKLTSNPAGRASRQNRAVTISALSRCPRSSQILNRSRQAEAAWAWRSARPSSSGGVHRHHHVHHHARGSSCAGGLRRRSIRRQLRRTRTNGFADRSGNGQARVRVSECFACLMLTSLLNCRERVRSGKHKRKQKDTADPTKRPDRRSRRPEMTPRRAMIGRTNDRLSAS